MPHPKGGYRLKDNTRVPGVTTITGRFKESGGLIHWAWELGRDGKDYRAERDKAADAGTLAHEFVELHIAGSQPQARMENHLEVGTDKAIVEKAWDAYGAYLTWERQSNLKIVEQEMSLVSEDYRFGGTLDAVGKIDNKIVLLDWKTGNRIYPEMLCQIAAYAYLLTECRGIVIEGFHLCRFAKEHGDFAHHYFPDLSEAWQAFKLMRELYDLDKGLKKRAA